MSAKRLVFTLAALSVVVGFDGVIGPHAAQALPAVSRCSDGYVADLQFQRTQLDEAGQSAEKAFLDSEALRVTLADPDEHNLLLHADAGSLATALQPRGVSLATARRLSEVLNEHATTRVGATSGEDYLFIDTDSAVRVVAELVANGEVSGADGGRYLQSLASRTGRAKRAVKSEVSKARKKRDDLVARLKRVDLNLAKCGVAPPAALQGCKVAALFSATASFSAAPTPCPTDESDAVTVLTAPAVTAAPPTAPPVTAAPPTTVRAAAALALVGPRLFQPGENGTYHQYRYSATSGGFTLTNSPTDIRDVQWDFTGVPTALIPGTEFTITVTGKLTGSPGVEAGANYTGAVSASGLTVVKQQNAFFYQGQKSDGIFTYRVPIGATKAQIGLGGDWGIGTFAIYCYGACS